MIERNLEELWRKKREKFVGEKAKGEKKDVEQ